MRCCSRARRFVFRCHLLVAGPTSKLYVSSSELKRRLKAEQKAKEKAEKQAAAAAAQVIVYYCLPIVLRKLQ